MKELEIYKAEILRRSEEKIKKRRKLRRRILVCCIPLCLCAVLGTIVLLQRGGNPESGAAMQDVSMESIMESTTEAFTAVEIRNLEGNITVVEDRAKVGRIYQTITARYAAADANTAASKVEEFHYKEFGDRDLSIFAESVPLYQIRFTTDSGTRTYEFWLDGWLVEDGHWENRVFLSPEQMAELEALLTEGMVME